jgi:hypothetical protein
LSCLEVIHELGLGKHNKYIDTFLGTSILWIQVVLKDPTHGTDAIAKHGGPTGDHTYMQNALGLVEYTI